MENEAPLSPAASTYGLLDFSGKQSMNHLGQDLLEEPSISRVRSGLSGQGIDLSEINPKRYSLDRSKIRFSSKLELKKGHHKVLASGLSDDDDELDVKEEEITPRVRGEISSFDVIISERKTSTTLKAKSPVKSITKLKDAVSTLRRERSLSIRTLSTKKSRAGSVFSERRGSEIQSGATTTKMGGGMSFVTLVAMARRMGLIKKAYAFEDYMSKDQFNMIKDLSTGRFDKKEEKRSEQMVRLKKKLLLGSDSTNRNRIRKKATMRKRAPWFDWKFDIVVTGKRMYKELGEKIKKVITPNGRFRLMWDILIMVLIFYDQAMVPLTLAFDIPLPYGIQIWEIITTVLFILDIFLNFNTGIYDKGMLIMDRRRVISSYLKGFFWMDFLASFPYQYVVSSHDLTDQDYDSGDGSYEIIRMIKFFRYMKLVRFVRVIKLKKIYVKVESYMDLSATAMSILGFIRLSLITLFIAHYFACGWHFISVLDLESHPESWLTRYGIVDAPWPDRYVASIYWATTTMITVGYGDIVPVTRNETLVSVFAMLVASGVFAYTMNRINLILTGLETTSEQYQRAHATITDYMRKKRVKKELQIKIKKYLEYALEVETSLDSNEAYLNAYLNQSLKNELLLEIHGNILLDNEIFMRFDNSLIMRAALILKEKIFSPEDPVFLENEHQDSSIYLIHSGRVEIFNFKSNSFLKSLSKGGYFGEIAFFTGQPRTASARSTDFSALYLIQRNEFLDILNEFPLEREKFHEVKDKLSIYQDQTALNMKCYSCNQDDHIVNECPQVHAVISKQKYIRQYLDRRNKFMSSYIRSGSRSDKNPDRYVKVIEAARAIQVKIWEGDFEAEKTTYTSTNVDVPEMSEHPSMLMGETRPLRKLTVNQSDPLKKKSSSVDPKTRTLTSLDLESHTEMTRSEWKKKVSYNPSTLLRSSVHGNKSPKRERREREEKEKVRKENEKKERVILDDIDRIQNFVYYFPHNNFEVLCPQIIKKMKSGTFDYFSQSDTTKDTLKKFISILKERVRQRREENAAKENMKRRSSFFGKLVGSPLKSQFYKKRTSIFGGILPNLEKKKSVIEIPKLQENSNSESEDESP